MTEKLRQAAEIPPRPCDCDTCTCGNKDDARDVALWDAKYGSNQPIVRFSDDEDGLWVHLSLAGSYFSLNLSASKCAEYFVKAYKQRINND